jgi:hypothetical protein
MKNWKYNSFFLVNRKIGIFKKEAIEIKKKDKKQKQKPKNNIEIMVTAIAKMNQVQKRIWKKKMELKKKLNRN